MIITEILSRGRIARTPIPERSLRRRIYCVVMRVRRVKVPGPTEQIIDLLHFGRRDIRISGQCLGHKVIGLHLVEQLLPLERRGAHLLCGLCRGQGLSGGVELLTELIGLGSERGELQRGAFIVSEPVDGADDLIPIDLRRQIGVNHDGAIFEARADLLVEDRDDAGGIGPDFIARDVQIFHFCHTLEICRDLLERLPFGGLDGQPRGIHSRVVIAHASLSMLLPQIFCHA